MTRLLDWVDDDLDEADDWHWCQELDLFATALFTGDSNQKRDR